MEKSPIIKPIKKEAPDGWFRLEIDSNGSIYEHLTEFLGDLYMSQGGRFFGLNDFTTKKKNETTHLVNESDQKDEFIINVNEVKSNIIPNKSDEDNESRIPFNLPHMEKDEWIELNYNHDPIWCNLYHVGSPVATMNLTIQHDTLYLTSPSIESLKKLIFDAKDSSDESDPEQISIFTRHGSHWTFSTYLHKRKIDSVFIPNKAELIDDVFKFHKGEKDYLEWGIPYKRNYFLYGPPGTGKTSIITAIASEFSLNVHICSFSNDLDDTKFCKLISSIRKNSILVLEDIDSLFRKREKSMNSQVSFSCVLNILDGLQRKHGLITFMTTNHKDELDEALTRPGRIDMSIKFDFATKDQIKDMFENFLPKQKDNFKMFYRKIEVKKISTAVLQKFLFEKRECENIMDHMDYFTNLCSQYGSNDTISEHSSSIYQ